MPDYRGFTAAVAAAVKPDYADVVARAARRKRRRGGFGAVAVALVLAGGGGAYALTADQTPAPAPVAIPGPWRTVVPQEGGQGPQPQPSYVEIRPGFYDPAQRDKPLTGIYPSILAGDLDHLYLEYQDCHGATCKEMQCPEASCTRMLAASADRGRTWRKLKPPQGYVALVHRNLVVVARDVDPGLTKSFPGRPAPHYWTSIDGGLTWRQPETRAVDALPVGLPVHPDGDGIAAFDPASGDVTRIEDGAIRQVNDRRLIETPLTGELWMMDKEPKGENVVKVSTDGARTWDTRVLPEVPLQAKNVHGGVQRVYTADGRTVYLAEWGRTSTRLHVSTDGGHTWQARAKVELGGPLMGVLPVGDRTVIVQGLHGIFRSLDRGVTFTRVGDSLGGKPRAVPGGGFIINTNNNEYSAWLSEDGAAWTYVRRPEVP